MYPTFQGFLLFSEGHPAHQSLTAEFRKKQTLNSKLKAKPKRTISECRLLELGSWIGHCYLSHFFLQRRISGLPHSFVFSPCDDSMSSCPPWTVQYVLSTIPRTFPVSFREDISSSPAGSPSNHSPGVNTTSTKTSPLPNLSQ